MLTPASLSGVQGQEQKRSSQISRSFCFITAPIQTPFSLRKNTKIEYGGLPYGVIEN